MILSRLVFLLFLAYSGYSQVLPNECKNNKECTINDSVCLEGHCTCREGFAIDGTATRCLKVSSGYNDECEESVQCSQFLGAGGSCESGVCACLDGYHYLHGFCHLSKGLNDPCRKDEDCFVSAEYQAAKCQDNVCKCNDGYYQREYNTCREAAKRLEDDCILDSDCRFDENATCSLHKCSLKNETNYNSDDNADFNDNYGNGNNFNNQELIYSLKIGRGCNADKDCAAIANSECGVDKKCKCKRAHYPSVNRDDCIPEIGESCKSTEKIESRTCKKGLWTCQYDMANLKDNQRCAKIAEDIRDACQYREQCQLFGPRAGCVDGECRCDSGSAHWLERERFCWLSRKIGDTCASDYDCPPRGTSPRAVCRSEPGDEKLCSCPDGSHMDAAGEYCLINEPEIGSYCEKISDCGVPNSSCKNNKCNCQENYLELEGKCQAGLYAACKVDNDCFLNDTVCHNETTCQCRKDFVVSPKTNCVRASNYREQCKYDVQCSTTVSNARCSFDTNSTRNFAEEKHGRCECIPDYYYRANSCFKKKRLGEVCTANAECFALNSKSVCRNGICSCEFEYKKVGKECQPVNSATSLIMQSWLLVLTIVSLKTS